MRLKLWGCIMWGAQNVGHKVWGVKCGVHSMRVQSVGCKVWAQNVGRKGGAQSVGRNV